MESTGMNDNYSIMIAFGLTLFAGLSTGIGSAISILASRTNTKFLSYALGFSAGVMIYVAFVELFFQARGSLNRALGNGYGEWLTVISFFGGIGVIAIIDKIVPEVENPHEMHKVEEMCDKGCDDLKLKRLGLMSAVAIAIHNFPEGIAVFMSALSDISLGFPIAVAVAIHNIPEGIAVAVPIYFATGNRSKAFGYSFLSGLAEPLGAALGYLVLLFFFNEAIMGVFLGAVAGIMVFISLDELLPAAREYGEAHIAVYGLISGMAIMAFSLLLLH